MGKLVDKLHEVSQNSASGFGFLGRAQANARKPRPSAILVALKANETAAAEAAAKNGADAILLTGWTPGADVAAMKSVLEASGTLWGVELSAGGIEGGQQSAKDAGASFVVLAPSTSARALFEDVEHLDRVLTIEVPKDDLALMMLRGQSLLPAQVALIPLRLGAGDISGLTIGDYTRLHLIVESLRFPALVTLAEPPDAASVKTLVHLGAAGLVLPSGSATSVGAAVKALREELEKTPIPNEERGTVLLGGLVGAGGQPTPAPDPQREPEREPEHE